MVEVNTEKETGRSETVLDKNLDRVNEDLDIMERHSADLQAVEDGIQESMVKRVREHKDSCLHSIPKPIKHTR
jgi:hypothetical protein